jgi:hypothetical protein
LTQVCLYVVVASDRKRDLGWWTGIVPLRSCQGVSRQCGARLLFLRAHAVGTRRHEMAQNHGNLERCIAVPAVIEVCRLQSRHSYKRGRLFSTPARRLPQPGQVMPSGQRRSNKNAAQFASSGNAFWNSESERPWSFGVRPGGLMRPVRSLDIAI